MKWPLIRSDTPAVMGGVRGAPDDRPCHGRCRGSLQVMGSYLLGYPALGEALDIYCTLQPIVITQVQAMHEEQPYSRPGG